MFKKLQLWLRSKPKKPWLEHQYMPELEWFDEYCTRQSGPDVEKLWTVRWAMRDLIEQLYVLELEQGFKDDRQHK